MNVDIYDPAENSAPDALTMTPAALAHVRRQALREGAQGLLLEVAESGCNGYMYALKFVAGAPSEARAFRFGEIDVFVRAHHWPLLRGIEIDFVTEGLNGALAFKNPNASGECGCGESFSVRADAAAQ